MKWIFQRFSSPDGLCGIVRLKCATYSGLTVRLPPAYLCGMLRLMQSL